MNGRYGFHCFYADPESARLFDRLGAWQANLNTQNRTVG
ncbi:hypothetical protein ALQ59_102157 [Pseudomonas syringae pv. apii]|uniref:Uncharacterized protein n=2 Tax=Pseudomonas syringae group genomosp. 3 TaxID=251701 RepID=A0A3M3YIT9_9PSED|nr:hypothetical protein ALQ58_101874 [Pseudomonas syringae pv. apii]RMO82111.1 hypothetical protein ALQ36_102809 [Pseudomonas syringae pv. primulae]RMN55255.1 hypothetical protein ALQ59_102157 [Pseudomonas syringae pv. apii]RMN94963.1 hypothetical protein ALQ49_101578 [Pseudomonas syringae pv. apii]RMR05712.1 hypothetical protein ALP92_102867 [Pseudomonas syringae pv. primulae]